MNKAKSLLFSSATGIVCAALLTLAGCGKYRQYEPTKPICAPVAGPVNLEKAKAIRLAEDVLGQMHFVIAKVDVERGYISTQPLAGAQFFEFWRSDNVGAFNSSEANLHTIRRIVELNIIKQGDELCINCQARTQRLNMSGTKFINTSQIYDMFSRSEDSLQELQLLSQQKSWTDLGRDAKLETEILKRIERKIAAGE